MTYQDGLQVRVVAIKQSTVTGTGPGIIVGAPMTIFKIQFANRTGHLVNLEQVIVSVSYGRPAQAASPVYNQTLNDFSTVLAPGGTQAASYAFSVPVTQLGSVTMAVDFDGTHMPAIFAGEVRP